MKKHENESERVGGGDFGDMTNQQWLETATAFLRESGLDRGQAHLHARLLLDGATRTRFAHLLAPEAVLEARSAQRLQSWLTDAAKGRPIPYILGKAPFWGLDWEVDEHVLIPRPETELLVETVLELLSPRSAETGVQVADLGTGSGIIVVCLKRARPDLRLLALDISPDALALAARNAARHGAPIEWLRGEGDWIAPLRPFGAFAALVSNPPYIAAAEIERLEPGVRDFEPRAALDGGADGLDPYRAIAREGRSVLAAGGFVALEIGAGQFGEISAIFRAQGWQVEAPRLDLAGTERVLVAR